MALLSLLISITIIIYNIIPIDGADTSDLLDEKANTGSCKPPAISDSINLSIHRTTLIELVHLRKKSENIPNRETELLRDLEYVYKFIDHLFNQVKSELTKDKILNNKIVESTIQLNNVPSKQITRDSCGSFLDCESCFATNLCAWCIGERICVPDEIWMCQGENDQVGSRIGKIRQCPITDSFETRRLKVDEEESKVQKRATEQLSHLEMSHKIENLAVRSVKLGCLGWYSTSGCSPDGAVEPHNARTCEVTIENGMSGYCQCEEGIKANEVTCLHDAFTCSQACNDFLVNVMIAKEISERKLKQRVEDEIARVRTELENFTVDDLNSQFETIEVAASPFQGGVTTEAVRDEKSIQRRKDIEFRVNRIKTGVTGTTHPYLVLGVEEDASSHDIRRAYLKMSLLLHPDKNEQDIQDLSQAAFADLIAAYEILSNPSTRSAFDDYGNRPGYSSQYEYEQSGQRDTRGLYGNFPYITSMTEKLWAKRVSGNSIWLVELYAAWCGACQQFVPTFKTIAQQLSVKDRTDPNSVEIEVGAVNCEIEQHLCGPILNVRAYPTLRIISKNHGVQQEYLSDDKSTQAITTWAKEVAKEWKFLFDFSKIHVIHSKDQFDKDVIANHDFWMILILDGVECSSCKTAKTNMMRLSAALNTRDSTQQYNANISCGVFDCSSSGSNRDFCDSIRIPKSPFSPQVRGWSAGFKFAGDAGEGLYNPNEIEPHYALELIERVMRLSSKRQADTISSHGSAKFEANLKDAPEDNKPQRPKPQWNGPRGRATLNAVHGGGGGMRQLGH